MSVAGANGLLGFKGWNVEIYWTLNPKLKYHKSVNFYKEMFSLINDKCCNKVIGNLYCISFQAKWLLPENSKMHKAIFVNPVLYK